MSFQYTYDAKGKPVGVFVPIHEWEKITDVLKKKATTTVSKKILNNIEKGLQQVRQIEKGSLKAISLKQLLNEL